MSRGERRSWGRERAIRAVAEEERVVGARGLIRILILLVLAAGCKQEQPRVEQVLAGGEGRDTGYFRVQPGPAPPLDEVHEPRLLPVESPYAGNPWAERDGLRLYSWMNCLGCHAEGGGSIGPTLWDDQWIYGGRDIDVFESIYYGRPNGMPAFGEKLPEEQIWKLVTYVKSLRPGGGMINAGEK